ncbi:MAG: hypothetical protein M3134_09890 [Actinomycetota bacterium]|nr:hypothetical protein [Actinomycetota bacterium]
MKVIPTRVHGILDFVVPAGLMLAPKLLRFDDDKRASALFRGAALGQVAYSLFTDYERGVVRKLPMKAHLALDAGSAAFLAASPWLLGFSGSIAAPHLVAGLSELGIALTTETEPRD